VPSLWNRPPTSTQENMKRARGLFPEIIICSVSYSFAFNDLAEALASSLTTTSPVFSP
jgi:hypothetical protein